jgi:hypothetical protein
LNKTNGLNEIIEGRARTFTIWRFIH